MHSSRVVIRSPQVCRFIKAPSSVRPMSLYSSPQYMSRFAGGVLPSLNSEIAPLFRFMDEFVTSARTLNSWPLAQPQLTTPFQPLFDVRESVEFYELRGEMPGVDSHALEVEFTDAQTLVIRGTTSSEETASTRTEKTAHAAVGATEVAEATTVAERSDAASTHSISSYQRATVEDETVADVSPSMSAQPTPAESTVSTGQAVESQGATVVQEPTRVPQNQQPRYWISERNVGSFQRVFRFPSRIDQEAVKASLKNGVLHIKAPKASATASRRVSVE